MDVRVEDLRLRRSGREILSIPALSIHSGRTTAVLGPNGAGKTTLLRVISGLDHPDSGRVLVGGTVTDARRRLVSYAFQENVFLRRSLLENLIVGLTVRGLDRTEARARALASLRLLGIEALADRRADQISGGEARRASLARAMCLPAPILLLDEPLAGLDGHAYVRLCDELPALIAGTGATTLVVTHQRDEAFRLCDDVVVLIGGTVRAAGTKHEIGQKPRQADVAEVLGYTVLEVNGGRVAVPEGALVLSAGPTNLVATVEGVSDLVHDWDVTVAIQQRRVRVRIPRPGVPPQPGDRVWLEAKVMYEVS